MRETAAEWLGLPLPGALDGFGHRIAARDFRGETALRQNL
jgi:hypothetical protein